MAGRGDVGVIEDVFVREPWRQRGIAKHLLYRAMSYLQAQGSASVKLEVKAPMKRRCHSISRLALSKTERSTDFICLCRRKATDRSFDGHACVKHVGRSSKHVG